MRISKVASALVFSLTITSLSSHVRAQSTLAVQSTGGIFSNVDSVSQLNPHVVLDYVSSCSDLTGVIPANTAFPEHSDCLFENFVSIQFPGQVFGNRCSSPDVDIEDIKATLFAAVGQCQDFDELEFIDTAAVIIQAVFADQSCWEELCEEDSGILLHIESEFLQTCADVDLPYPNDFEGMFTGTEQDAEQNVLTCMLQYVMDTTAFEFGLDSAPPVPCFPPGYDSIATVCESKLAKPAYDMCTDNAEAFGVMLKDADYHFSLSMYQPYYDDDDTYSDDDNDDDSTTNDFTLLEKFCSILERLTTEQGLDCLFEICDTSVGPDTDMPSDVPSVIPSLSPMPSLEPLSDMPSTTPTFGSSSVPSSGRPSASPSALPSLEPMSDMPSITPTIGTSSVPSFSAMPSFERPSASPSALPSLPPSSEPTNSPSESPSASPSAAPSSTPTFQALQSIIDVAISAEFSIEIAGTGVPNLLPEIVEDSVEEMLPGNVNATVISIGGTPNTRQLINANPLRRRRLQSVPVELLIEATQLCYHTDSVCNTLGINLAAMLNDTFSTAIADGSITTYIREEGAARNIDVLENATIVPDSLVVTTSNVELNDPITIENPEVTEETSGGPTLRAFGVVSLGLFLPSALVVLTAA